MSHLSYCCRFYTNLVTSFLHVFAVASAKLCITDLILKCQRTKINEVKWYLMEGRNVFK